MLNKTWLLGVCPEESYCWKRNRRHGLSFVNGNYLQRVDATLLIQFVNHVHASSDRETERCQPGDSAENKTFLANQIRESVDRRAFQEVVQEFEKAFQERSVDVKSFELEGQPKLFLWL